MLMISSMSSHASHLHKDRFLSRVFYSHLNYSGSFFKFKLISSNMATMQRPSILGGEQPAIPVSEPTAHSRLIHLHAVGVAVGRHEHAELAREMILVGHAAAT